MSECVYTHNTCRESRQNFLVSTARCPSNNEPNKLELCLNLLLIVADVDVPMKYS